jgi:UDP-glucuronate decarboxylase
MGTLNMLGLAKRVKARFLISSTSGEPTLRSCFQVQCLNRLKEIYGDPEVHPQPED